MPTLYRCRASLSEIAELFKAEVPDRLDWKSTVWPRSAGLVIRMKDGRRVLEQMHWGLTNNMNWPPGVRDPAKQKKPTPVLSNMMSAVGYGDEWDPPERCLIILDSFALPDGEAGKRTRSWFGMWDAPLFAWAGLWRDGLEHGASYAGLLIRPNPLVATVSDAMPVIVRPRHYDCWLTAPLTKAARLRRCYPQHAMYMERTDERWTSGETLEGQ